MDHGLLPGLPTIPSNHWFHTFIFQTTLKPTAIGKSLFVLMQHHDIDTRVVGAPQPPSVIRGDQSDL